MKPFWNAARARQQQTPHKRSVFAPVKPKSVFWLVTDRDPRPAHAAMRHDGDFPSCVRCGYQACFCAVTVREQRRPFDPMTGWKEAVVPGCYKHVSGAFVGKDLGHGFCWAAGPRGDIVDHREWKPTLEEAMAAALGYFTWHRPDGTHSLVSTAKNQRACEYHDRTQWPDARSAALAALEFDAHDRGLYFDSDKRVGETLERVPEAVRSRDDDADLPPGWQRDRVYESANHPRVFGNRTLHLTVWLMRDDRWSTVVAPGEKEYFYSRKAAMAAAEASVLHLPRAAAVAKDQ